MLPGSSLVANAASKGEASLTLLTTIALLMVVVLVTAIVIIWLGRWTKRPAAPASGETLSLFRSLYEQGECSKEEYERIRAKLAKKLKQELQLPETQSATAEDGREPEAGRPPAANDGLDTSIKPALPNRDLPNDPDSTRLTSN